MELNKIEGITVYSAQALKGIQKKIDENENETKINICPLFYMAILSRYGINLPKDFMNYCYCFLKECALFADDENCCVIKLITL